MIYKNRLRFLRERNGLTQKFLAEKLGLKKDAYNHYENEKYIIPIKHLNTICNYFDVSIDYVFEFTEEKQYPKSNKEINSKLSGERLKEFRKEKNLTQDNLAEILNTLHQTISNYEKDKSIIATPFIYDICRKYKISADYLLGKTDKPKYFK